MIASVLCRRAALAALLGGAAIASAFAGDRPATPGGAEAVQAFLDRFLPAPPPGSPRLASVKTDGQGYVVSADLSAINGVLGKPAYEPATLVYRLFEQDDGKWRIVQDSLPRIVAHGRGATSVLEVEDYHQTLVIDPALAWWTRGEAKAGKGRLQTEAPPKLDQTLDFGSLKGDYATTVNADGTVSSAIKHEIGDVALKLSANLKSGASVNASGRLERAAFNIGVDGLKSRKLFDLVSLLSAHRADLAQHESELKGLLRALAQPGMRFVEGGEASKLMLASPLGAFALAGAKLAVGVTNAGPDSAVDATIDAEGLSLPAGLLPPSAADLTPSKVDVAFAVKGIDIAAAANQAIDSLRLGAPGPAIPDDDTAKIAAAMVRGGPLRLVVAPSHVVAPAIDADVEGEIRYTSGKPSGAVTVRMRGFDKTMNAVRGLRPDMAARSLPMVAMAKGLARTESDGALSWLIEVGDDRSIKVNGIPLGKTPN